MGQVLIEGKTKVIEDAGGDAVLIHSKGDATAGDRAKHFWYYKAGERALADIGLTSDKDHYLRDMNQGLGTWAQARAAGIDEQTISRQREARNDYYQEYLRTEAIEMEGVVDFVLVREDYKLAKPHPEPYLIGLKRLGAIKEETLVVEDSSRGLNSAVAAGIDCVVDAT